MNMNKRKTNQPVRKKRIYGHHSDARKTTGAFSTSHSIKRALPAISLNSAPGSLDRINVAEKDIQGSLRRGINQNDVRPNTTPKFLPVIKLMSARLPTLGRISEIVQSMSGKSTH